MRQIIFACKPSFEKFARACRREQFLQTMESVVPWPELEALIAPHYPKAGKGRQPVGPGIMLRSVCTSAASVHDKHMLPNCLLSAKDYFFVLAGGPVTSRKFFTLKMPGTALARI